MVKQRYFVNFCLIIFHCCFLSVLLQWIHICKNLIAQINGIPSWYLFQRTDLYLLQYNKIELAVWQAYRMYQHFLNVRKDNTLRKWRWSCLSTDHSTHNGGTRRSIVTYPDVSYFSTRWRWAVRFTSQSLWHPRKIRRCPSCKEFTCSSWLDAFEVRSVGSFAPAGYSVTILLLT